MIVRIKDLLAAEERLDAAEKALRDFDQYQDQWSGYERLERGGARVLELHSTHFERREALQNEVTRATMDLLALQQRFGGGGGGDER